MVIILKQQTHIYFLRGKRSFLQRRLFCTFHEKSQLNYCDRNNCRRENKKFRQKKRLLRSITANLTLVSNESIFNLFTDEINFLYFPSLNCAVFSKRNVRVFGFAIAHRARAIAFVSANLFTNQLLSNQHYQSLFYVNKPGGK